MLQLNYNLVVRPFSIYFLIYNLIILSFLRFLMNIEYKITYNMLTFAFIAGFLCVIKSLIRHIRRNKNGTSAPFVYNL